MTVTTAIERRDGGTFPMYEIQRLVEGNPFFSVLFVFLVCIAKKRGTILCCMGTSQLSESSEMSIFQSCRAQRGGAEASGLLSGSAAAQALFYSDEMSCVCIIL